MNALVYVDIDQGALIREKHKVAQNEKRKKLPVFSYSKNLANFEAFHCHFIKHNLEYIQKHGAIFFENKLEKKTLRRL